MMFTTKDKDNGRWGFENCAMTQKGAWWYEDSHDSNLNGLYLRGVNTMYAGKLVYLERILLFFEEDREENSSSIVLEYSTVKTNMFWLLSRPTTSFHSNTVKSCFQAYVLSSTKILYFFSKIKTVMPFQVWFRNYNGRFSI